MLIDTELSHLRAMIQSGDATLLPTQVCRDFNAHLVQRYPWVPVTQDSIAWARVEGSKRLNLVQEETVTQSRLGGLRVVTKRVHAHVGEAELTRFVRSTRFGRHEYAAVVYGANEPGLWCSMEFAIRNLYTLFSSGNGARYLFGIDVTSEGTLVTHFDDFVEYDADDDLFLSGQAIKV